MSALLTVKDLAIRFGGLRAVQDLSFEVAEGEILGIIGPNGAGKTTTFNAIAGAQRPTSGSIDIDGIPITGRSPERVAAAGIARTFQTVRLFAEMTVEENIAVAASTVEPSAAAVRTRVVEVAEQSGLGRILHAHTNEITLADQKKVEIARALALSPRILLLDEMMSGLTTSETSDVIALIKKLNSSGLTIVVIEHVIRVILELAHRVLVLDHGILIAEGEPHTVMRDPEVIKAYLGAQAARTIDQISARSGSDHASRDEPRIRQAKEET